jgi:hypothetical protein
MLTRVDSAGQVAAAAARQEAEARLVHSADRQLAPETTMITKTQPTTAPPA